jgi:hypothetical protein
LASPPDKRVAVESLQSHLNRFRDTEREELWLVGRDCVYDRQLYVLYWWFIVKLNTLKAKINFEFQDFDKNILKN